MADKNAEYRPAQRYEWSAALGNGENNPVSLVGIAYAEDRYPDARVRVRDELHAWRSYEDYRDRVVLVRRPVADWEVVDGE